MPGRQGEAVRVVARPGGAELSALKCGAGPPVVLLHGIPTGAELWRGTLERLAEAGYEGWAFDLPGYGMTRLPADADHSLGAGADLVAEALRRADRNGVWVVGHDTGGVVAALMAIRHRDLVSRMTLVNSVSDVTFPAPRARIASLAARAGMVRLAARARLVPNPVMRWFVRRALAPRAAASDAELDHVLWQKFKDPEGAAAFERSVAAVSRHEVGEAAAGLPSVAVPCQIVWGLDDPFQRWEVDGDRLRTLLPRAALAPLEGCGHFVPLECTEALVDALLTWARELDQEETP